MTIPADQLARWRAMMEKATPGPWAVRKLDSCDGDIHWQVHQDGHGGHLGSFDELLYDDHRALQAKLDAELAAESRQAMPRLLAEVERLREALFAHCQHWTIVPPNRGCGCDACVALGEPR